MGWRQRAARLGAGPHGCPSALEAEHSQLTLGLACSTRRPSDSGGIRSRGRGWSLRWGRVESSCIHGATRVGEAEAARAAGAAGGAGGAGSAGGAGEAKGADPTHLCIAEPESLAPACHCEDDPALAVPLARKLLLRAQPHFQDRPLLRRPAGSFSAVSAPDGRPGRGPGDPGTGRDGPPWDAAQAPRGGAPGSLLAPAQPSSLADALAPI